MLISIKKLLLLLLLTFGFIGSANADAVCRDGWASASEGSGTCSWHKGVSEWTYDGRFEYYNNNTNPHHRHGIPYLPPVSNTNTNTSRYGMYYNSGSRYAPMTASTYGQGYMEGAAIGNAINLLLGNSNSSKPKVPSNSTLTSYGNGWRCNSGYKKVGNRCQKIYAPTNAYVSGSSWKCVTGYKKVGNRCEKIFIANFYTGADAYEKGDYKTAIKHWELLAEYGNADAQYNLGFMYENGIGLKKSDYWAFLWINKAAQLGQTNAQFTLGNMYRTGAGIGKDFKQTVKWFKEAGKKGHVSAQFNLGAMYINGDGVHKSLKDAKYWISLANKNGHERAQEIWDAFELSKY